MLDDVRRRCRIDPEQTYLSGFSGGGRMACTIAFALPEYFGGVIPFCGTNPLNQLAYLRHRVHDRLSVAFVTGATDFNRKENEVYMFPSFKELEIRSRLWVVPRMGHGVPPPPVLAGVYRWLADDLPRRRKDARNHPDLAAKPDQTQTPDALASAYLKAATAALQVPEQTWRGVALLQGITRRWPETAPAKKAKQVLKELLDDPARSKLIAVQGGAEEQRDLAAQARALERFGRLRPARSAWKKLADLHPDTPAGKKALVEIARLTKALDAVPRQPYLGIGLQGQSTTVNMIAPKSPAAKAGIKAGDQILKFEGKPLKTLPDLARALQVCKPGQKVKLEIKRADQTMELEIQLTVRPDTGD
jgi:hypothetical protein